MANSFGLCRASWGQNIYKNLNAGIYIAHIAYSTYLAYSIYIAHIAYSTYLAYSIYIAHIAHSTYLAYTSI